VNTKRTHVVLPADLVSQIDTLVGKRKRSRFLADLASREVRRLRLLKALKRAAGSWKDEDHPELKNGAAAWIEQLRQEDEERFRRVTKR
jgi:Arc/MetJ-type ribon-helix-helix transcriptional regulator